MNTSQYRQSFFPKTVGPWNQLSFADSPTLENFRTNLLSTNRALGALLSINQNQKGMKFNAKSVTSCGSDSDSDLAGLQTELFLLV